MMTRSPEELKKEQDQIKRQAELKTLPSITYDEYVVKVLEWLMLPDASVLKFLHAVLVCNLIPNLKPIWAYLKGPSGCGKSEILASFIELPNTYPLSNLTPHTLISGMLKTGASLLPRLENKTVLWLDQTNLNSMNRDDKQALQGQFRDLYDGHMIVEFGNGQRVEWGPGKKIGMIAATTEVIDIDISANNTLGERYIHFQMPLPNRLKVAMMCLINTGLQQKMEIDLKNAAFALHKGFEIPESLPDLPEEDIKELIFVADFITQARSGLVRNKRGEIIFVPGSEMPTRVVKQLRALAGGCVIVNGGKFLKEDMTNIVYKSAFYCIPKVNKIIIMQLARKESSTTKEIAEAIGYPTEPIRHYLENMAVHHICTRKKGEAGEGDGKSDRWSMSEKHIALCRKHMRIDVIEEEKNPGEGETIGDAIDEINKENESNGLFD